MHAREDMLLNHYSWVDEQKQTRQNSDRRARCRSWRSADFRWSAEAAQQGNTQDRRGQPMFGDGPRSLPRR